MTKPQDQQSKNNLNFIYKDSEILSSDQVLNDQEVTTKKVQEFAELVSEAGFSQEIESKKAQEIINFSAYKLREYQKEIAQIIELENAELKDLSNLSAEEKIELENKKKKRQERVEQIANEVFTISCASKLEMSKSLQFCNENNLTKDINKFGENGLNPLTAAMVSGKNDADLQKLKDNGADENAPTPFGGKVSDLAKILTQDQQVEESQQQEKQAQEQRQQGRGRFRSLQKVVQKSVKKISQSKEIDDELVEEKSEYDSKSVSELIDYLDQKKESERKSGLFGFGERDRNFDEKMGREVSEFLKLSGIEISDPNALNKALFYSVKSGNATMPMVLIKLGADINYRENGMTMIEAAMISNSQEMLPILVYLSSPETRRNAIENSRQMIDRFEDKVDVVRNMVDNFGQQDFNDRNAQVFAQKEIADKNAEIEAQVKKIAQELENQKKPEEQKKSNVETKGYESVDLLSVDKNSLQVAAEIASIVLATTSIAVNKAYNLAGEEIFSKKENNETDKESSFVDMILGEQNSKTSDQSRE